MQQVAQLASLHEPTALQQRPEHRLPPEPKQRRHVRQLPLAQIRRRSGRGQAEIRQRSGGDQTEIRRRSGGGQVEIRRRSGGDQAEVRHSIKSVRVVPQPVFQSKGLFSGRCTSPRKTAAPRRRLFPILFECGRRYHAQRQSPVAAERVAEAAADAGERGIVYGVESIQVAELAREAADGPAGLDRVLRREGRRWDGPRMGWSRVGYTR